MCVCVEGGGGGGAGIGAYAASQTTVLHMKRLNQTVSPIFLIFFVFCFSKAIISDVYFIRAHF